MIKPLRKRHRQIWMAWAVLLPLGIILAWMVIPNQKPVRLLKPDTIVLLPDIIRSVDRKDYRVNIRSNKERDQWQLEWKNKTVLMVPSAVVYRIPEIGTPISKAQLIGRIETKGDYVFTMANDSSGNKSFNLVLYDFIHEKKIDSINLLP